PARPSTIGPTSSFPRIGKKPDTLLRLVFWRAELGFPAGRQTVPAHWLGPGAKPAGRTGWETAMYLEDGVSGGGFEGRSCKGCQLLIMPGQAVTRVTLDHDPNDMSGDYHDACGKPIQSLTRALGMMRRFGR
ncbi:MAG: hypothetical protein ACREDY_17960, partial [Bradyrhizobium sp.]